MCPSFYWKKSQQLRTHIVNSTESNLNFCKLRVIFGHHVNPILWYVKKIPFRKRSVLKLFVDMCVVTAMVLIMINHTTPFLLELQSTCAFLIWLDRSNHQRCSVRKAVLRNFTKFTGRHLWQSLFFNEVAGLRSATLLKKRLWHGCFLVNFMKFLRAPFLQNSPWTTASDRKTS